MRLLTQSTHEAKPESDREAETLPDAAFYCVSSGMFFLGAVALINSLRLLGHTEPVFVLDCGLSPAQREALSAEATVVPAPGDSTPFLLKTPAPLRHPARVMVLIDADIILTQSLAELIERAAEDRVIAVEHGEDRFFPEWGELLGGTARYRRYVSSSLVLLGGQPGSKVVRIMDQVQRQVELERTPYSGPVPDFAFLGGTFPETDPHHPFYFADQDVLNAVLATRVDAERVELLDRRAEALTPFTGLELIEPDTLRCAYEDGTEPYAVHHYLPTKPWLKRTYDGVYSRLLRRLLSEADVALRVPRSWIPLRLKTGPIAHASRKLINARERFRWRVEEPLTTWTQSLRRAAREGWSR